MRARRFEAAYDDADAVNLGNVIPFTRLRGDAPPLSGIGAAERPAPDFLAASRRSSWWLIVFAGSLLAHAGLAVLFLNSPGQVPAIGLETISVEVVFGADAAAGVAATPSEQQAEEQPQPEPEQPVAKLEPPEPERAVEPAPAVPPPEPEALSRPEPKEKEKQKDAALPSQAASGVGRGQSRSDANYNGRVAAHLARYKRFPDGARRSQGTAIVRFSLADSGKVVAVKLVQSSGVPALDEEAQASVRRASPFPAPPAGAGKEFTVPLKFQLH